MTQKILSCGHHAVNNGRHCGNSSCLLWIGLCDFHSGRNKNATCNQAR